MKRRKGWIILGSILIAILAILTVVGFLFRDDGSLSGFVTEDGQREYTAAYEEAMSHLPEPVESIKVHTDFGVVQLYKFQGAIHRTTRPCCCFPEKDLLHPCGRPILAAFRTPACIHR